MTEYKESYEYAVGIKKRVVSPYFRIFELYAVLVLIVMLAYCIFYNLKGRESD